MLCALLCLFFLLKSLWMSRGVCSTEWLGWMFWMISELEFTGRSPYARRYLLSSFLTRRKRIELGSKLMLPQSNSPAGTGLASRLQTMRLLAFTSFRAECWKLFE